MQQKRLLQTSIFVTQIPFNWFLLLILRTLNFSVLCVPFQFIEFCFDFWCFTRIFIFKDRNNKIYLFFPSWVTTYFLNLSKSPIQLQKEVIIQKLGETEFISNSDKYKLPCRIQNGRRPTRYFRRMNFIVGLDTEEM